MAALITFTVNATTFSPVISLIGGSTATATWTVTAGGSGQTTGLAPAITGLTAPATITLGVASGATDKLATDLLTLDLGFDHTIDAGTYNIGAGYDHATQQVTAISGLNQATAMTIFACMNSPLTGVLDFTGMSALQYIECFGSKLTGVTLTGLSSLIRLNIEQNNLTTLDLNPVRTTLRDLRSADQQATGNGSLTFTTLSGPMAVEYHFCDRSQYVANAPTPAQLPAVQQFWVWDSNLSGAFPVPASAVLTSVMAAGGQAPQPNCCTSADFTNTFQGASAAIDLSGNNLASVTLTGCPSLTSIDLHNNNLSTAAVDSILATVDSFNTSGGNSLNLAKNRPPSAAGQAHVTALTGRGWTVTTETVTSAARSAGVLGDDFHRANATGLAAVGNGWQAPSWSTAGANIVGNTLVRTDGGSFQGIINPGGGILPPDYTVMMRFPSATYGNYLGLIGRYRASDGNCIQALWGGGSLATLASLWIGQGRSFEPGPSATITPLNAIPASWANNTGTEHTMAMQMQGSTITVYVDGVAIAQATCPINATLPGTGYGISGDGMGNRVYYSIGTVSHNAALAGCA